MELQFVAFHEGKVPWADRRGDPKQPTLWACDECYATTIPDQQQVAEYEDLPIPFDTIDVRLSDLALGFSSGDGRIDFCWKPYEQRDEKKRADYDKLLVSIYHSGILKPLIVCRSKKQITSRGVIVQPLDQVCVLIGMRRAEIGLRMMLGRDASVSAVMILEDVSLWWRHDVVRLNKLKAKLGEVSY